VLTQVVVAVVKEVLQAAMVQVAVAVQQQAEVLTLQLTQALVVAATLTDRRLTLAQAVLV
jgi:hypothetical protein